MSMGNPGDGRGDDETRDIVSTSTATEPVTGTGWQAVADELADALQEAMLRNPSLTARGWIGPMLRSGGTNAPASARWPSRRSRTKPEQGPLGPLGERPDVDLPGTAAMAIGPARGRPVSHLEDAVSSKTTALVTRWQRRKFIDIAAALDRYDRAELMRLTFTRDYGSSTSRTPPYGSTNSLRSDFAEYGFDPAAVDALRARFADWPRHGDDDQEGHPAEHRTRQGIGRECLQRRRPSAIVHE